MSRVFRGQSKAVVLFFPYFSVFYFLLTLYSRILNMHEIFVAGRTRWATNNYNMMSFSRFVNKRAIYRLGIISLAHAPVHVTEFPVVNVHVDELSSARIWQHKLCATLSANVNINYRLPIKVYYCICTLRHIRIEINHGSQNVFWVLIWVGGYLIVNFITRLWLGIKY